MISIKSVVFFRDIVGGILKRFNYKIPVSEALAISKELNTASSTQITVPSLKTTILDSLTPGGIDLTGDKVRRQLTTTGNSVEFTFTPEMIDRVQNAPGFTPVIINMQPLINLPLFLGLKQNQTLSVATAEKL